MSKPQSSLSAKSQENSIRLDQLRHLIRSKADATAAAEAAMLTALEQLADLCDEKGASWSVGEVQQLKSLLGAVARANTDSSGSAYECMRLQDHEIAHYRRQLGLAHEHLFD